MIGLEPSGLVSGGFFANSAPQPLTISGNTTKNFGVRAAPYTIAGTITGAAGTELDVFAGSGTGFTKTSVTVGGGGTVAFTLPAQATTTYQVGVGPKIPEMFLQPGAPPPPPPTFTFMPPPMREVVVQSANVTGIDFTLTATNKTITGRVINASGSGVPTAGVFARPVASSTTATSGGFGTGGQTNSNGDFTLNVTPGTYLVGAFKPGMPPAPDQQIVVPSSGSNTPASLTFTLDAATSITISGTVKDNNGNAIPYAGVGGRKVVSTSDTTPVGGDSGNFVGGPTDANGSYILYVNAGTWVIEAFAPGFGRLGSKTVTVTTSSVTGQDFSAQTLNLGSISGTATKASVAQQGVMVRAEGSNGTNMGVTDAAGAYSVKVPAGTYTVICYFPGVGESTPLTNVSVTANTDTPSQNCSLAAPITITVEITDGTNPITGAFVDARDSNGRGNGTNVSTASSTSAVYTVNVPPGTYTVRAGHPMFGQIGATTSVNTTRTVTFTAGSRLYAVIGTLSDGSSALSSAWVSLTGTPTGQTNIIHVGGQTDSAGAFTVNVPAGSYQIRADKPGYRSSAPSTISVTAAKSVGTITLAAAARTISGTILISGSGVSNAFVDAVDGLGGFAVAQTDSNGAYSLAVDNGTWTVRGHSLGYEGSATVVVSGSNVSGQNITLSAISGFTIKQERQETITPTSGGLITNTDIGSSFKMNIPANALGNSSNAGTVKTQINTAIPTPPSGTILSKNAVTITAVDSSGQPIKNLNDDITIVIPYTESDIPSGQSENNLVLGVWNDATKVYDTLSTTLDTTANTLTATLSHFSDVAPTIPSTITPAAASPSPSPSSSSSGGGGIIGLYGTVNSSGAATRTAQAAAGTPAGTLPAAGSAIVTTSLIVFTNTAPLSLGSEGSNVVILQMFLESKGFLVMPPGISKGYFGLLTKRALIAYQKSIGLEPVGIMGPKTRASIEKANALPTASQTQSSVNAKAVISGSFTRGLDKGMMHAEVKQLQMALNSDPDTKIAESGVGSPGNESEYFGTLTLRAVQKFQVKHSLASQGDSGYGYVGPKTRAKLNEILKNGAVEAASSQPPVVHVSSSQNAPTTASIAAELNVAMARLAELQAALAKQGGQ